MELEVIAPSGRTFYLRELNAREQMFADSIGDRPAQAIYYRMAMSITAIKAADAATPTALPKAKATPELNKRLEDIAGREMDAVLKAYTQRFMPDEEELKNESSVSDS